MAEYSVGIATRNKIYEVSKRLFYEKGIKGASYAEICREAQVNRGLIPYYFKSKNHLAALVFGDFVDSMGQAVETLWDHHSMDPPTENVLIELLQFKLLESNANVREFYGEAMASPELHDQQFEMQGDVLANLQEVAPRKIDNAAFRTITCMMHGTENELVQAMRTGYLTERVEDFVYRDIEWIYHMLGFSAQDIDKAYQQALALSQDYQLACDKQFRCTVVKTA